MDDDPVHDGDGAVGLPDQRIYKRELERGIFLRARGGCRLTPEMLPMIVSVSLSRGAILMSKKKVIVKRLNSIQEFRGDGMFSAQDKTGTLTLDHVILERHWRLVRKEDNLVLRDAYLISHFQNRAEKCPRPCHS